MPIKKTLFYKRQGQSANFGQSELTDVSGNCVVMGTDTSLQASDYDSIQRVSYFELILEFVVEQLVVCDPQSFSYFL